jgi:hypothetical protein
MNKTDITKIRELPGIKAAKIWKDRIYLQITGNGARMAGEGNSKVWIDSKGELHAEIGKGTISSVWHENLWLFKSHFAAL